MIEAIKRTLLHNILLKTALEEALGQIQKSRSLNDLNATVQWLKRLPFPLRYENSPVIIRILALFSANALLLIFTPIKVNNPSFIFIYLITCAVSIRIWGSRTKHLHQLSKDLIQQATYLANNLQEIKITNKEDHANQLAKNFDDFKRGSYGEITQYLKGYYEGAEHNFTFKLYRYEYYDHLDLHTVGGLETDRIHKRIQKLPFYTRHSIIVPFHHARNIQILQQNLFNPSNDKLNSASIKFNEIFNVYAEDELLLAKFLTPKVLETFLAMAQYYPTMNVEFNASNDLCISFADDTITIPPIVKQTDTLDNLISVLESPPNLPKLWLMLDYVHTLMKFSDNNFQGNEFHTLNPVWS